MEVLQYCPTSAAIYIFPSLKTGVDMRYISTTLLILLILSSNSCGSHQSSRGDNVDITGTWSGGFTGSNSVNFSITINVLSQFPDPDNSNRDLIEGTWSSPNAGFNDVYISGDITSGFINGKYLKFNLEKSTGNACYYRIHISDYVWTNQATEEAESLTDTGSYFDRGCIRSTGTMELVRSSN